MHDNSETDDGFVIPAQHARKARIRQKKLEVQQEFQFRQPSAPRHKHGAAEAALLSKHWQKVPAPSKKNDSSQSAQGTKGSPPWGSFLASLQASQTQQKPSSKDIVKNWGGTVFWNGIWEQSILSEAEEAKKEQQAAVDAAQASNSDGPEAAAASATGDASRHHSSRGPKIAPGPLNKGLLLINGL